MEIKAKSLDEITSGETVVLDKGLVLSTEEADHEKLLRCRSVGTTSCSRRLKVPLKFQRRTWGSSQVVLGQLLSTSDVQGGPCPVATCGWLLDSCSMGLLTNSLKVRQFKSLSCSLWYHHQNVWHSLEAK